MTSKTFMETLNLANSHWAGILVPDLCLEETEVMQSATKKAGLELTQLVTPTTPQERMKRIAAVSEGFVYLVSVTGRFLFSLITDISS